MTEDLPVTVSSVHKKLNKLVHLLYQGVKGVKVNSLKWKERKGGIEAERERKRERRGVREREMRRV